MFAYCSRVADCARALLPERLSSRTVTLSETHQLLKPPTRNRVRESQQRQIQQSMRAESNSNRHPSSGRDTYPILIPIHDSRRRNVLAESIVVPGLQTAPFPVVVITSTNIYRGSQPITFAPPYIYDGLFPF